MKKTRYNDEWAAKMAKAEANWDRLAKRVKNQAYVDVARDHQKIAQTHAWITHEYDRENVQRGYRHKSKKSIEDFKEAQWDVQRRRYTYEDDEDNDIQWQGIFPKEPVTDFYIQSYDRAEIAGRKKHEGMNTSSMSWLHKNNDAYQHGYELSKSKDPLFEREERNRWVRPDRDLDVKFQNWQDVEHLKTKVLQTRRQQQDERDHRHVWQTGHVRDYV